ncbi:MAG TPA: HAD hydrolase-like protein [Candidatus Acidoferrum sp.]|nr:HAD hydrolase-like protein [Candidatus Acidoferrum sp.]
MTDAKEGIERCIRHAVQSVGGDVPFGADLTKYIGPPLRESLAVLLRNPTEERLEEALRRYRQRFEATGMYENEVYPGIPELLECAGAMSWRAYVVTSKPEAYAKRIVRYFRLDGFFAGIYGSQMDGKLARKEDLIGQVLNVESIPAAHAVYIGDRDVDIRGAQANGVDSIGVTYGYGSRQELESAGATWICDSPAAVREVLAIRFGTSMDAPGSRPAKGRLS